MRLTLVQPKGSLTLTTHFFGVCPLTFILTEDKDWSTEYIGVPPPCIYHLWKLLLNQVYAGRRPMRASFLKIDPVRIVALCGYVCVCVCAQGY